MFARPVRPPESDAFSAPDPSTLGFEQEHRPSESMSPLPAGGVAAALRDAAEAHGIDPIAELFNEALRYAQEGHLRLARERLQMLLCMAPDDGEAKLMLARVYVAGRKWNDALAALDEARTLGMSVPRELRQAVEDQIQGARAQEEEQRVASSARNQGELVALRNESRSLRSESAELHNRIHQLEREVRKWAWGTLAVSVVAMGFVGSTLAFSNFEKSPIAAVTTPTPPEVPGAVVLKAAAPAIDTPSVVKAVVRTASVAAPPVEEVEAPVPVAPSEPEEVDPQAELPPPDLTDVQAVLPDPVDLASQALATDPEMAGAEVELHLDANGKLTVLGKVQTFRQRKRMEHVLAEVPGIQAVNADSTIALSRVAGAEHVVSRGDTLSHIAYAYYGNGGLTKPILDANPKITANSIRPGMKLTVPPLP